MSYKTIQDPQNKEPIDRLYAWLSRDDLGNEGIIAVGEMDPISGLINHRPLVTADPKRVAEFEELADSTRKYTRKAVVAAVFVRES